MDNASVRVFLTLFLLACSCDSGTQKKLNDFDISVEPPCLQAYEKASLSIASFAQKVSGITRIEWSVKGDPEMFYTTGDELSAVLVAGGEEGTVYKVTVIVDGNGKTYASSATIPVLESRPAALYLSHHNAPGIFTGRATSPFTDFEEALNVALEENYRYLFIESGDFEAGARVFSISPERSVYVEGGFNRCWVKSDAPTGVHVNSPSGITFTGGGKITFVNVSFLSKASDVSQNATLIQVEGTDVEIQKSVIKGPVRAKNSRALKVVSMGSLELYAVRVTGGEIVDESAYALDVRSGASISIRSSILKACEEKCYVGYGLAVTDPGGGEVVNSFVSAGAAFSVGFGVYLAGNFYGSPLDFKFSTIMGSETGAVTSVGIGNYLQDAVTLQTSILHSGYGSDLSSTLACLWNLESAARVSDFNCVDFWTGRGGQQCDTVVDDKSRYMVLTGSLAGTPEPLYCLDSVVPGAFSVNPGFKTDLVHIASGSELIDYCPGVDNITTDIDGEHRPCGGGWEPGPDEVCSQ